MVVSLTTNIGLAKPDDAELAANWTRFTNLQEDNNLLLQTETNKALNSYTPTLLGNASTPNVGAGRIRGEYQDLMGFVVGAFVVEFTTPGITVGSGEYGISLPFPVDSGYHAVGSVLNNTPGFFDVIGEGFISDASAAATSGSVAIDAVTIAGVSYARLLTEAHTAPVKTARVFRDNMPFAVADGDRLSGNFMYKRA